MSILAKKADIHSKDPIDKLIFETGIRIAGIVISKKLDVMVVLLTTGHLLKLKISDIPRLKSANEKQLAHWELVGNGIGVHWNSLDEDLSLKGFISSINQKERSSVVRRLRKKEAMYFA